MWFIDIDYSLILLISLIFLHKLDFFMEQDEIEN